MLHWGLAAGSALGSSPPRSSTSPGCHRLAPESVPTGAPGPFAGGDAEPRPCSPGSPWPHHSLSAIHSAPAWPRNSHLYATTFTGTQMISLAPPVPVTQLSCLPLLRHLARAWTAALLTKWGGQNLLSMNRVPSNAPP